MSPLAVADIPFRLRFVHYCERLIYHLRLLLYVPVFVRALPASISAPENCVNTRCLPRVAVPVIEVRTYALSALEEPASTNVNNPPVTSEAESASSALVKTPATPTAGAVVTL